MNRIFCIGNRLIAEDRAGPAVYDELAAMRLPAGTEVVEAGLAGADLVWLTEGCQRVVFVDQLRGWAAPGAVVRVDPEEVAAGAEPTYGHAAGLAWLLRILPAVADRPPGTIHVVGLEAPVSPTGIRRAAELAVALAATEGVPC